MRLYFLKTFLAVCLVITFLTAIPLPVQAAVVVLKNGDRITGRIVKRENSLRIIRPIPAVQVVSSMALQEPNHEDLCRLYILWGENRGPTVFPTSRCGFGVMLGI